MPLRERTIYTAPYRQLALTLALALIAPLAAGASEDQSKLHIKNVTKTQHPEEVSPPPLDSPVLGYLVTNAPRELRPILGLPGASTVGAPLAIPEATHIDIAPGHKYALVRQHRDTTLTVMQLNGTAVADGAEIPDVPTDANITFSPSGSSAVLYSAELAEVRIVRNLPDHAFSQNPLRQGPLPSDLRSLAVDDTGSTLAAADSAGRIYGISEDGTRTPIFVGADISAMAYRARSLDLLVYDRVQHAIFLITSVAHSPSVSTLATDIEIVDDQPISIASSDGERYILADRTARQIFVFDLPSGMLRREPLKFEPATLQEMRFGSTFLLSPGTSEPTWFAQIDRETLHIHFVPAPHVPASCTSEPVASQASAVCFASHEAPDASR
jgi:hypothetical protein